MKHYPRQRTDEYNDYIDARMQEVKQSHARTMQTGQDIQGEILKEQRQAFIDSIIGYKGGFIMWGLVVLCAFFFLT